MAKTEKGHGNVVISCSKVKNVILIKWYLYVKPTNI